MRRTILNAELSSPKTTPKERNSPSSVTRFAAVLLSGLAVASCAHGFGGGKPVPATQPPAESCILGNAGLICFDSRLSKVPAGTTQMACNQSVQLQMVIDQVLNSQATLEQREMAAGVCYVRPYLRSLNYVATNPGDDNAQQEWIFRNCYGPPKK